MNVILLGPPGAGKGTQSKRLQTVVKLPHVASGDLFRAMAREDTQLAREVRSYMDRGEYVPDDLTIKLVLARLREPDAQAGFLLDGFPRTIAQARALDQQLSAEAQELSVVLYITAPVETLVRRLTGRLICPNCSAIYNVDTNPPKFDMICDVCGHTIDRRSDEAPEVVRTRLDTYILQTKPLVDYYRKAGVLAEIDGSRNIEKVEAEVDSALGIKGVAV